MSEVREKVCAYCGRVFLPTKNDIRIKYCSKDCCRMDREKNHYMEQYYSANKEKWESKQRTLEYKQEKNRKRRERYANDSAFRAKKKEEVHNYYQNNPDVRLNQRLKKFGINLNEYRRILKEQGGKCAICGSEIGDVMGNRLYVDHDHVSGKVRGLLCSKCNFGLGNFNDDIELMKKAIKYLEGSNESSGDLV